MESPYGKYFRLVELKCKCGECASTGEEMQVKFMARLNVLRRTLGFPFIISSAYRCPAHNLSISKSGESGPHTTGQAIDILVRGTDACLLVEGAYKVGFTGFGINQKGSNRFIHLDDLESDPALNRTRPMIFSY